MQIPRHQQVSVSLSRQQAARAGKLAQRGGKKEAPALEPAGSPAGSAQGLRSLQTQVLIRRLGPNMAPLGQM